MLQNVTLLAIVAIHTAANEPPKVRQVMNKIHRNVGSTKLELAPWQDCTPKSMQGRRLLLDGEGPWEGPRRRYRLPNRASHNRAQPYCRHL